MHANFKLDAPLSVVVEGRLIEDAVCTNENGCTFTYTKTGIPSISQPVDLLNFKNGINYKILGTGFKVNSD